MFTFVFKYHLTTNTPPGYLIILQEPYDPRKWWKRLFLIDWSRVKIVPDAWRWSPITNLSVKWTKEMNLNACEWQRHRLRRHFWQLLVTKRLAPSHNASGAIHVNVEEGMASKWLLMTLGGGALSFLSCIPSNLIVLSLNQDNGITENHNASCKIVERE